MSALRNFSAAILAFALTGCASMDVSVRILDKQQLPLDVRVESNTWLEASRHAMLVERAYYSTLERTTIDEVHALLDDMLEPLTEAELTAVPRPVQTSAEEAARIKSNVVANVNAKLQAVRKAGDDGLRQYLLARDLPQDARQAGMEAALAELRRGRELLSQFTETLKTDLDKTVEAAPTAARAAQARRRIVEAIEDVGRIANARHPLFGGATLFEDPLAIWVIGSPEQAWGARFNRSYGAGYLGNVDIAVKLESDGVFTLKGVRLDAAKTTAATFAVMRQAVNVFAGAIPLPSAAGAPAASRPAVAVTGTNGAGDLAAAGSVPDASRALLMQAENIRDDERLRREQAQFALATILDAIVRNRADLASETDAVRARAIWEVGVVYRAHKNMLDMNEAGGQP